VNTADDFDLWGLHICPDLDTVMYTLAGGVGGAKLASGLQDVLPPGKLSVVVDTSED